MVQENPTPLFSGKPSVSAFETVDMQRLLAFGLGDEGRVHLKRRDLSIEEFCSSLAMLYVCVDARKGNGFSAISDRQTLICPQQRSYVYLMISAADVRSGYAC